MSTALAYVTDANFLGPTIVSALSFEQHTANVDILVFVTEAERGSLDELRQWLNSRSSRIELTQAQQTDLADFGMLDHLSPASFGRLEMHKWLGDCYERVIYLDGDTLAGPCALDFNVDLHGATLGAVDDLSMIERDQVSSRRHDIGLDSSSGFYFNSGVLVIDWQKWRDGRIGELALAYLRANPNLAFGDQCALNHVCDGLWDRLDISWNCQSPVINFPEPRAMARVLHFTGSRKPWHLDKWRGRHRFSKVYKEILPRLPIPSRLRAATWQSKTTRALRPLERCITSRFKSSFDWQHWLSENT